MTVWNFIVYGILLTNSFTTKQFTTLFFRLLSISTQYQGFRMPASLQLYCLLTFLQINKIKTLIEVVPQAFRNKRLIN